MGPATPGPLPVEAAQQAADRGVRVYTIGFGTENGSANPVCGRQFIGGGTLDNSGGFGGGGGEFGGFRRGIDEDTLEGGGGAHRRRVLFSRERWRASHVFESLPTSLITKHEVTEISVAFTALGALLAIVAIGLSMRWQPFP